MNSKFNTERGLLNEVSPIGADTRGRSKNDSQMMKDKRKRKENPMRICKKSFKKIDRFAQSVSLTWKG